MPQSGTGHSSTVIIITHVHRKISPARHSFEVSPIVMPPLLTRVASVPAGKATGFDIRDVGAAAARTLLVIDVLSVGERGFDAALRIKPVVLGEVFHGALIACVHAIRLDR